MAGQLKKKAGEFSSGDSPQSDDSLGQAKKKIREVLDGTKKPSSRRTPEKSAEQHGLDDLLDDDDDDLDREEEAA